MAENYGSRLEIAKVTELLGGQQVLRRELREPLQAHELLVRGLPSKALIHLVETFVVLNWDDAFEKAEDPSCCSSPGSSRFSSEGFGGLDRALSIRS